MIYLNIFALVTLTASLHVVLGNFVVIAHMLWYYLPTVIFGPGTTHLVVFVGATHLKKPKIPSFWIGMKFSRIVSQVIDRVRFLTSYFKMAVISLKYCYLVNENAAYAPHTCSSIDSSWSIVHLYLLCISSIITEWFWFTYRFLL